jgi:hypothetical protein
LRDISRGTEDTTTVNWCLNIDGADGDDDRVDADGCTGGYAE